MAIPLNRIGTSFLVVSKEDVVEKDVSCFTRFVDSACVAQIRNGQKDYATVVLSIDGFNDDPRPLWDIPEVGEWIKALHAIRPCAPYFLTPDSIQVYVACLEPFLAGVLPKKYGGYQQPVISLLTYAMDQFTELLRILLPTSPSVADAVLEEANNRVFSAVRNLYEGREEPL